MMRFQKNISPNRLSISGIYELYKTLEKGLRDKPNEYLIDEVISILRKVDTESIKKSLHIMYGKSELTNSLEVALKFSKGIKDTGLLSFVTFLEKLRVSK